MNEQHARLDLVGIGFSVDLEGDFSFHGLPCLLPVYDVVTKRAENQVAPGLTWMPTHGSGNVGSLCGWQTLYSGALRTRRASKKSPNFGQLRNSRGANCVSPRRAFWQAAGRVKIQPRSHAVVTAGACQFKDATEPSTGWRLK